MLLRKKIATAAVGISAIALCLAVTGATPTHIYTALAAEKDRATENSADPQQTEVPTPVPFRPGRGEASHNEEHNRSREKLENHHNCNEPQR